MARLQVVSSRAEDRRIIAREAEKSVAVAAEKPTDLSVRVGAVDVEMRSVGIGRLPREGGVPAGAVDPFQPPLVRLGVPLAKSPRARPHALPAVPLASDADIRVLSVVGVALRAVRPVAHIDAKRAPESLLLSATLDLSASLWMRFPISTTALPCAGATHLSPAPDVRVGLVVDVPLRTVGGLASRHAAIVSMVQANVRVELANVMIFPNPVTCDTTISLSWDRMSLSVSVIAEFCSTSCSSANRLSSPISNPPGA